MISLLNLLLIVVHLAGDSTMAEKKPDARPETGWGEALQAYFDTTQVRVENHAKNGRSTRTFITEGLWQQLIDRVKPGDYVIIEFGHNDEVPSKTDRYTTPEQYRANLMRFISETRARKAIPVLMTPVTRRKFDKNGIIAETHKEYSEIVRQVARETQVAFVDMDRKSQGLLSKFGVDASAKLYYPDQTHFSPLGAQEMAKLAAEGLREQKLDLVKFMRSIAATPHRASDSLLAAARIAKLPAAEQAKWGAYIRASDSVRIADETALAAELKVAGKTAWTPAPTDQGFFLQDSMTAAWFASPAARQVADYLVSYQAPNGGWSKRMGFTHVRMPGEAYTSAENEDWFSTLDNSATTEQLRFLASVTQTSPEPRYKNAYLKGLTYLIAAQEPNGCWPQIFPLAASYHDAITFNDDVTVNALEVLTQAATVAYLPADLKARAASAVNAGNACILATQVSVNGAKTIWGQQHDPLTLQPVKARAYEHPSLSSRESAGVLNYLMSIKQPSPEIAAAVNAGVTWLKEHAIYGFDYHFKGDLTPKPGAGPIWSRFYEIPSYRPIFSDRDGIVRYNLSEIGAERRYNYGWYTDEATRTIKRYERWSKANGKS